MGVTSRTWAEINLDALENNIKNIRKITNSSAKIIAVVKADAYGHGAEVCAEVLLANGADMLAVACPEEAYVLRNKFSDVDILLLGTSYKDEYEDIIKQKITPSVSSLQEAIFLDEAAKKLSKTAKIHIKVDSGMGRLGFLSYNSNTDKTVNAIKEINNLENIEIEGIFTHFSCADEESDYTKWQFDNFKSLCDELKNEGVNIKLRHCANSATIYRYPEFHLDAVRPGIILYGYHTSSVDKEKISLLPVMSIKSRITHVKELLSGSFISYGNEYETASTEKIATVPVGYADGFIRANKNKAQFIFNGNKFPVVGRICMDQCMIDVTSVNNINAGDVVTVMGSEGNTSITADDLAKNVGTISYEILCIVSKRLQRLYLKNGKCAGIMKTGNKLLLT